MEVRTENRSYAGQERSLKSLSPNVAALLCYAGGWISGIVFLVLEQKNRYVRFHAMQSIIVFGTLTLANAVLGHIPGAGAGFSVIIGITGFILWIILMVKAVNGEQFKMPWAGNLAERLANEASAPLPQAPVNNAGPSSPQAFNTEDIHSAAAEHIQPAVPPIDRGEEFRDKYYSYSHRTGRTVASAVAIAWNVALLIFFNFYNQYIAWFEPLHSGGTTQWQRHTLITSDFNSWLPIVTAVLVLSIIGHAVVLTYDKYILRQAVRTGVDILGAVSAVTLLSIFPFDFSILPGAVTADGVTLGLTIGLVFVTVCCGISALVNFIKLVVHSVKGEY